MEFDTQEEILEECTISILGTDINRYPTVSVSHCYDGEDPYDILHINVEDLGIQFGFDLEKLESYIFRVKEEIREEEEYNNDAVHT